jgi:hypothetical protein
MGTKNCRQSARRRESKALCSSQTSINSHCRWWWFGEKLWAKNVSGLERRGLLGLSSGRGLGTSLAEVRPFIGASVCLRAGEPGRGSLLRTERGLMARLFSKNCVLVLVNPALGSTPAPSAGGDLFLRTACGGLLTVLWSLRDFGSNGGYVFLYFTQFEIGMEKAINSKEW